MTPGEVETTPLHGRPPSTPGGAGGRGHSQPLGQDGQKHMGVKPGLSPLPATPLHLIPLGRGTQEASPPASKFKVKWRRARLSTQEH